MAKPIQTMSTYRTSSGDTLCLDCDKKSGALRLIDHNLQGSLARNKLRLSNSDDFFQNAGSFDRFGSFSRAGQLSKCFSMELRCQVFQPKGMRTSEHDWA